MNDEQRAGQPSAVDMPDPSTRPDVHNAATDEVAASRHLCGMLHLPSGRECRRPERHSGGCDFTDAAGEAK